MQIPRTTDTAPPEISASSSAFSSANDAPQESKAPEPVKKRPRIAKITNPRSLQYAVICSVYKSILGESCTMEPDNPKKIMSNREFLEEKTLRLHLARVIYLNLEGVNLSEFSDNDGAILIKSAKNVRMININNCCIQAPPSWLYDLPLPREEKCIIISDNPNFKFFFSHTQLSKLYTLEGTAFLEDLRDNQTGKSSAPGPTGSSTASPLR